jgi:hypothetical protein
LEYIHYDENATPERRLANAIVWLAAEDYKDALVANDTASMEEIEAFFNSAWYRILCPISAEFMLKYIRRECEGSLSAVLYDQDTIHNTQEEIYELEGILSLSEILR